MNIFLLGVKNVFDKPLSYTISLLLLTLGAGIISTILLINHEFDKQFRNNINNIDLVVGAKGSPLQLVLANVFHMDAPTGNISMKNAKSISENPLVEKAIYLAYGDNYRSYRIVGCSENYPKHFNVQLEQGTFFKNDYDVNLGYDVAKNLGLSVGDRFHGAHGLVGHHEEHTNRDYHVSGIYQKSNTVIDRLILSNIETVHKAHDHEHEEETEGSDSHHEHEKETKSSESHHEHEEETKNSEPHHDEEITAILIQFSSPLGMFQIPNQINKETGMQSALPTVEISRLFSLLGVGLDGLELLAIIIIFISALSIFLSLYNSVKEKKYELALLRVLGASRFKLLQLTCQESLFLIFSSYLISIVLSRFAISKILEGINQESSFEIIFTQSDLYFFLLLILIGLISALIPALKAFNLNISNVLSEN